MLELQVRDTEGLVCPANCRGEIWVRGDQVSGEYKTRSLLTSDGWLPTNDGGFLDSDGFLFIEGRLDDVIVRGGENISLGAIEDVLLAHSGVTEVSVVGIPDDEWGEVVGAAVVADAGATLAEADLRTWVRDRLRSSHVPAYIDFRSSLPYGDTGKVLRSRVKLEFVLPPGETSTANESIDSR
jgi:fatty-acyl-CoA synthase